MGALKSIAFSPRSMEDTPAHTNVSKRGKRILESLVNAKLASRDAVQALLNMADPFPDGTFNAVGFPGCLSVNTLPAPRTFDITITAPPGLAVGATWDLHCANLPIARPSVPGSGGTFTCSTTGAAVLTPALKEVQTFSWVSYPTGSPVSILDPAIATTGKGSWTPEMIGDAQAYRFTCMGVELQNISAPLYRGGSAYAYRFGAKKETWTNSGASFSANRMSRCHMVSPYEVTQPSDIINFHNTYQGRADDGVVSVNLPFDMNSTFNRLGYTLTFVGKTAVAGSITGSYVESVGEFSDWNYAGAFLTGLPANAAIKLHARVGLEFLVSSIDTTFQSFSRNPVPVSPELVEIFSKILSNMPAGFDYKDNPLGEWFDSILRAVAEAAPIVGNFLTPVFPAAGLIGKGIGTAAQAVRGVKNSTAEKVSQFNQRKATKANKKPLPATPKQIASSSHTK